METTMKTPQELNSANQTSAFMAFAIVIAVVSFSQFIAGYKQRQTLSALRAEINANQTMIDASQARLNSMKRQLDNIKVPNDWKK